MTDLAEGLADKGIRLRDYTPGQRYLVCPECSAQRKPANRKKPCLSVLVKDDGAQWNCHHCDWKGGVRGSGDQQTNGEDRGPEPKAARQPPANPQYHPTLFGFFEKRGISRETVKDAGLYFDRIFFPQTGQKEAAIVFPYRLNGLVVNNKYRSHAKDFRQDAGAVKGLYNADSLLNNDECLFSEGEIDVLSLLQAKFPSVVSLPDGAPAKWSDRADRDDARFKALENCAELLAPIKKFILAVDNDGPGDNLAHQLALRLGPARCFRPVWPDDCKDPNEVLVKHGSEMLRECVERAQGYPIKGLREIETGMLRRYRDSPDVEMFGIGVHSFDHRLKFRPGQLVVVHGRPGDGKTTWVQWLSVNLSRQFGWRWAVCSTEHDWNETVAALAEQKSGFPYKAHGLNDEAMTDKTLDEAESWLARHYTMIVQEDENEPITLDFVMNCARTAHIRHGIRGLIIDPWNDLAHHIRDQTKTDYIGESLRRVKLFARHHNLVAFVLVHPAKLYRDHKTGKQPIPTLYDAEGSAHWFNKCDIGLTVHRPNVENTKVEILVHKVKRKDQGRPCSIKLDWQRASGQYKVIGEDGEMFK